jgi:hypothetical protein
VLARYGPSPEREQPAFDTDRSPDLSDDLAVHRTKRFERSTERMMVPAVADALTQAV